jgi:hypothetical protein
MSKKSPVESISRNEGRSGTSRISADGLVAERRYGG